MDARTSNISGELSTNFDPLYYGVTKEQCHTPTVALINSQQITGEDCEANGAILVANRRAPRDPTKAPSKGPLFSPPSLPPLFLSLSLPSPTPSTRSFMSLFLPPSSSSPFPLHCSSVHGIVCIPFLEMLSLSVLLSPASLLELPCAVRRRHQVVSRYHPECLSSLHTFAIIIQTASTNHSTMLEKLRDR